MPSPVAGASAAFFFAGVSAWRFFDLSDFFTFFVSGFACPPAIGGASEAFFFSGVISWRFFESSLFLPSMGAAGASCFWACAKVNPTVPNKKRTATIIAKYFFIRCYLLLWGLNCMILYSKNQTRKLIYNMLNKNVYLTELLGGVSRLKIRILENGFFIPRTVTNIGKKLHF